MHNYQQGCHFKPAHLDRKNGTHWVLCLPMAVSQHCFLVISFCRIVRSSLDDGDAQWVKQQQLGRTHCCLHHLCCFCSADGSHPARHGGFVSLSACLAPALVGGVLCWSFSLSSPREGWGFFCSTCLDTLDQQSERSCLEGRSELPATFLGCTVKWPILVRLWERWVHIANGSLQLFPVNDQCLLGHLDLHDNMESKTKVTNPSPTSPKLGVLHEPDLWLPQQIVVELLLMLQGGWEVC